MNNQKRYDDAVYRLTAYGYEVVPDALGYVVRHRVDSDDVSRMRGLGDLVEFARLVEWRELRQAYLVEGRL
jgi:hypothetical protein